jgi:hypothetical protein
VADFFSSLTDDCKTVLSRLPSVNLRDFALTFFFFQAKITLKSMLYCSSGVNLTNILRATSTSADPKSKKYTDDVTVFLCFWDLHV